MNLIFNKITLHNFGSYGHAELDLTNKGFCLVSGQNNCPKDNAVSNGSGKSFLWSAICYTLTGETISGLKNNLKNINIEEDSCYTVLDLTVDRDHYVITRTHRPRSDLKLIKNDTDVSGKGIRESEQRLAELLPDLTKDLIASTILIGQGMPSKFSSFSPSGRKEMLEKLTKSDYMLEDIKNRVSARLGALTAELRQEEDSILVANTTRTAQEKQLAELIAAINAYKPVDYAAEIGKLEQNKASETTMLEQLCVEQVGLNTAIDQATADLMVFTNAKAKENTEELESYTNAYNNINGQINQLTANATVLKQEIKRLDSITDICPTCGQKLQGVSKPDTTAQKTQLAELQKKQEELTQNDLARVKAAHTKYLSEIEAKYAVQITNGQNAITTIRQKQIQLASEIAAKQAVIGKLNLQIETLKHDSETAQKQLEEQKTKQAAVTAEIEATIQHLTELEKSKSSTMAHYEAVKKIETLIRRDFRGYLLINIIEFINKKAKEYSQIVFGTDALNVYLDGNALEISYCDKYFDSLSGGEKQRVDLILQFAIRDMLSTYLGYSANIIVLDEIFDALDKVSTDKILTLITAKLKDIESLFIISHHAETLNIGYDTELLVRKNDAGISEIAT